MKKKRIKDAVGEVIEKGDVLLYASTKYDYPVLRWGLVLDVYPKTKPGKKKVKVHAVYFEGNRIQTGEKPSYLNWMGDRCLIIPFIDDLPKGVFDAILDLQGDYACLEDPDCEQWTDD